MTAKDKIAQYVGNIIQREFAGVDRTECVGFHIIRHTSDSVYVDVRIEDERGVRYNCDAWYNLSTGHVSAENGGVYSRTS